MVEKIERKNDLSTENLVIELLQRFSCNRLKPSVAEWHRDVTGTWFENIVDQFLGEETPSLSLTDKEECQLFFMLSPAIQEIVKSEDSENQEEKLHLEHGVASLNADEQSAIDLSKVLYGILAGFKNDKKKVGDFRDGKPLEKYADRELDMLYSFTVSEIINTAVENRIDFNLERWRKGRWSSTICTKEYVHDNEIVWPTTAEVTGAVDGFILGSRIRDMGNNNDLKLSQILRMYYTKEGFKENIADQSSLSYCKRLENFQKLNNIQELEEQTINYMAVYRKISSIPIGEQQEIAISKGVRSFQNARILQQTEAEAEACLPIPNKVDTCETPSNVFAILDKRDGNVTKQKSVVGKLINELNIGLDEDTITIYLNADVENLKLVVNASDSKAQSGCELEDYKEYGNLNNANDPKILTDINNILISYEENQKSLLAVPAKVVVIFNFGGLKSEERKDLDVASRNLKMRHPYLTIIPIGNNTEYLKSYFSNNQPSRTLQWNDLNLIPDLKKKICEAPAVLQYTNCKTKSSLQDIVYDGYIREWHVQHWTMYPKYFLKTFSYKFEFRVKYGKIRVCFSRKEPVTDSGNSSSKCLETTAEHNFIEFNNRDPCKGRTVHNCDPFYFSVFGRDVGDGSICSREIDGRDVGCKRLDQIEYTIKHEGISCNSAKQLISSPLFQTLLTLLVTFYVLAWKK